MEIGFEARGWLGTRVAHGPGWVTTMHTDFVATLVLVSSVDGFANFRARGDYTHTHIPYAHAARTQQSTV